MQTRKIFAEKVRFLLHSAKERSTPQGVLVCEKTLNELASGKDKEYLNQFLLMFNKPCIAIEAYGYTTSEEFITINILRELARKTTT